MCPRQGSNFLSLPRKKVTKERGTRRRRSGSGRTALRCSVFGASRRTRFAACGRCAQTAARSQLTKRAAHAAPNPCAPRRLPRGPRAIRSFASQTFPVPSRFASGASEASVLAPMRSELNLAFVSPFGRGGRGRFFAHFLVDTRKWVGCRDETPARLHVVNKNLMRMQAQEVQGFDTSARTGGGGMPARASTGSARTAGVEVRDDKPKPRSATRLRSLQSA